MLVVIVVAVVISTIFGQYGIRHSSGHAAEAYSMPALTTV